MKLSSVGYGKAIVRSRRFTSFVCAEGRHWAAQLPSARKGVLSPALEQLAKENIERFLARVMERIRSLSGVEIPGAQTLDEQTMSSSGYHKLLTNVFAAAAATDHPDRHELLAEMIVRKRGCCANDLLDRAAESASRAIQLLGSRHFRMLGLMALLMAVRPPGIVKAESPGEYQSKLAQWWNSPMEALCSHDLVSTLHQDFATLIAAACIVRVPSDWPETSLLRALQIPSAPRQFEVGVEWFKNEAWWKTLPRLWHLEISRALLNSTGLLIGSLYLDRFLGFRTRIQVRPAPEPARASHGDSKSSRNIAEGNNDAKAPFALR